MYKYYWGNFDYHVWGKLDHVLQFGGLTIIWLSEMNMPIKSDVKYIVACLIKGFVCSILFIVGLAIGGIVSMVLGLKQPPMPEAFDTNIAIPLMIPAGMMIAVTLGELFKKFNQSYFERFVCLFLFIYTIYYFLQILEQIIFTTMMSFSFGTISDIFPALLVSLAIAWLWKPEQENRKIVNELNRFFAKRKSLDWTWRLILAWLAFVPLYYFVGRAISPLVLPYYEKQSAELGLLLPDTTTMIGMQFIRGALYLLSAIIVIVMWKGSKRSLQFWLGFSIFIQVAAIPLIVGYWLPIGLKIPHAVELSVDSFVLAFIYAELLFCKEKDSINTSQVTLCEK